MYSILSQMLRFVIWVDLFRCGSCKTFQIQIHIVPNNQFAKQKSVVKT